MKTRNRKYEICYMCTKKVETGIPKSLVKLDKEVYNKDKTFSHYEDEYVCWSCWTKMLELGWAD